ncbi:Uncharacterised protein [Streptococcus pneumoniae]|nr:Uncharacterised protein [Streptococcus pneumoniae]
MNLCERAHFNVATYRGEELGFLCFIFLSSKKAISGTTVSATIKDDSIEYTTANTIGNINFPITPDTRPIGKKTATVVKVEEVIATATSFVASRIISLEKDSFCKRRKIFSMTTMLSSTRRPTATAKPPSVRVLSVMLDWCSKKSVNKIDNGILTTAMSVVRKLRKKIKIIRVAAIAPRITSFPILVTAFSTCS